MAAAKRAQALLTKSETRAAQTALSRGTSIAAAASATVEGEVKLRATGKAIEKALSVAGWLRERGCVVVIRTGSVAAVDDVVKDGEEERQDEETEVPLARMRFTSMVEVVVTRAG
ncbi:hypothetical protein ANO11243_050480 [Dothideomycetidae sp. 11243]|nr:hypothetical protein ANO11243_050480 [fungal sp. No.11243]